MDQDEEKLLLSDNPFAYAVLAGLYMIKSRKNASKRYQYKRRLMELLVKDQKVDARGYAGVLLYFIDYLLEVPTDMKEALQEEIEPMIEEEGIPMGETEFPDSPTLKPIYDKIRKEGKKETTKEIALAMLRKNFADEDILDVTGITEKELNDIKSEL
ncbi:hypothetical protein SAMN05216238_10534 [Lentibacillus persicus]|uniref:Uncharacterized protein n=1 Tax=Lentibacillus persicus TaxID=640948 RepID=A0A1I1VUS8_9BACI|nr:hypothetical protein [Lentibacillus persicus]SFD86762.1 hypothetical protein SAMN05216238_10534 [Lentibacillus persicus]